MSQGPAWAVTSQGRGGLGRRELELRPGPPAGLPGPGARTGPGGQTPRAPAQLRDPARARPPRPAWAVYAGAGRRPGTSARGGVWARPSTVPDAQEAEGRAGGPGRRPKAHLEVVAAEIHAANERQHPGALHGGAGLRGADRGRGLALGAGTVEPAGRGARRPRPSARAAPDAPRASPGPQWPEGPSRPAAVPALVNAGDPGGSGGSGSRTPGFSSGATSLSPRDAPRPVPTLLAFRARRRARVRGYVPACPSREASLGRHMTVPVGDRTSIPFTGEAAADYSDQELHLMLP